MKRILFTLLLLSSVASAQFGFPPVSSTKFQVAGTTQNPTPNFVNFSTGIAGSLSGGVLTVTVAGGAPASTYLPLAGGTMTGAILFSADNTIDIGASAATRPRTGYFATSLVTPTLVSPTGILNVASSALTVPNSYIIAGSSLFTPAVDSNGAGTLTLGGTNTTNIVVLDNIVGSAAPVTLKGGAQTESATAYGAIIDTPADWSTTGNMLGLANNGTVRLRFADGAINQIITSRANLQFVTSGNDKYLIQNGAHNWYISNVLLMNFSAAALFPQAAAGIDLGLDGQPWKRLRVSGTTPVAGDFVLSAGWGSTASVGTISGNDPHVRFTATSAGTGQAANPTITYTYKNGTWSTAPYCLVSFEDASTASELTTAVTQTTTATTLVITFRGTPTAARTYTFQTSCFGTFRMVPIPSDRLAGVPATNGVAGNGRTGRVAGGAAEVPGSQQLQPLLDVLLCGALWRPLLAA